MIAKMPGASSVPFSLVEGVLADQNADLIRDVERYREALTPSAETKAAYIGEFSFKVELAHPRLGSEFRSIDVPWTTIKEIMAAIRARARAA
jgi:hypothetical protein